MKNLNTLTVMIPATAINQSASTAAMVPWTFRCHRTASPLSSPRESKNARRIYPISTRRSSPCMPKSRPPDRFSHTLEDIYGFEASEGFISDVTDKIMPQIEDWQNRPLCEVYPVLYIDAIDYSVRDNGVK